MIIETLNQNKAGIIKYDIQYIDTSGYEHTDKLQCVKARANKTPVEFFDEVYRAIEINMNNKIFIYTRHSEKLDPNIAKSIGLDNIKYTFIGGQWQFYDAKEKNVYYSLSGEDKIIGFTSISGINETCEPERMYKDNQVINTLKALEKAYTLIFGNTEIELTDEIQNKIIEAKKRIVFNKYELKEYEQNMDKLVRATRVLKELQYNLDGVPIDVEIIKSPMNKDKKCLLFKLNEYYAKSMFEDIFDGYDASSINFNSFDYKKGDIVGYSIMLNEDIFRLNTISINVVCKRGSKLIGVDIHTCEDTTSCIEDISKYFGFRESFSSQKYRLGEVPDQYKLIVLYIILHKNLLDVSQANIKELYGFKDIHKVQYINEI